MSSSESSSLTNILYALAGVAGVAVISLLAVVSNLIYKRQKKRWMSDNETKRQEKQLSKDIVVSIADVQPFAISYIVWPQQRENFKNTDDTWNPPDVSDGSTAIVELLEREETISALGPRELNTIANYAMVKTRVESDIKSMAGGGGTSSSMQSLSRKFSLSATNNNERAFLIKSKRMSALKYRINAEQLVILSDTKLKGSLNNLKQIPPSVAADEEMGIVNVMKSCSDNSKEGSTESVNSDLNGLNSKPKKSKKSSYLQAFSNSSLDRKKSNAQTSVVPSQPVLKLARESDLEWFKQLRRANHSNVAKFMSICNRKNVVMFFYEFSERGVLEDVLLQNRVPLNPHIRVILIKGLLNGVSYLYKNGYGSHGNLHCRSLYIDRSWNLKVAGFGLSNYVRETGPPFNIEVGNKDGGYDPPTEIYFVAPELLPVYPRVMKGTIKGDMFSIGMLMYTIINQSIPFEEVSDIKFILQSLLQDPMHSFELRPTFHRSTPEHYSNLVHLCWQSDPESRPALADVMHTMNNLDSPEFWALMREEGGDMAKVATRTYHEDSLRYMNGLEIAMTHHTKTKSHELQRSMTDLFTTQKKSTNQDQRITELERKLNESEQRRLLEIKKRDEGIFESQRLAKDKEDELEKEIQGFHLSILPPSLANLSLDRRRHKGAGGGKQRDVAGGGNIIPDLNVSDNYPDTVVMVVTIVQFNRLVDILSQTPHHMIELLKYYHAAIETILQTHPKVYCVERISDTCIFTSNAPDRNERAARDLCDMALKLQAWAEDPKIPWLSQKQQQQPGINISLRIGIHAGAICGGVVGSRVPKFVVMGETVNVAARIEAECAPGEIRISSVVMGVIDHAGYLADRLPETIDMKSRGGKLSQFRLVAGPSEG